MRPAKLLQSSYNDNHVMPSSLSQSSSRTRAPNSDTPRRKGGRERLQTWCGFYVWHRDCMGNKKRARIAVSDCLCGLRMKQNNLKQPFNLAKLVMFPLQSHSSLFSKTFGQHAVHLCGNRPWHGSQKTNHDDTHGRHGRRRWRSAFFSTIHVPA